VRQDIESLPRPWVADIGSGSDPFPLANILVDLYPDDNKHRPNHVDLVRDERVFIIADVQALPFRDQSLDFVFCRDVIEHVDDPIKAVNELLRVAKAGMILCPTMTRDWMASQEDPEGWSTHKWWVLYERKGEFHFEERKSELGPGGLQVGASEYVLGAWGGCPMIEEVAGGTP